MSKVTIVSHPLVQHKLSLMRQRDRSTVSFRSLLGEVSELLAYEVTRDLDLTYEEIETPMAKMMAPVLDGKKIVLVGILRSGIGIVDAMLRVLPTARVGHIGIYRDPQTLGAVEYYAKLPEELAGRDVIVANALLATGNTAIAAIDRIKQARPRSIKFICLVACPEGLQSLEETHPDVQVFTAAVDERLDDKGYVIPGLGDVGDRFYGTK
jgi:uracil phosphoribosyltransferase